LFTVLAIPVDSNECYRELSIELKK
jgi:hypothetical protein